MFWIIKDFGMFLLLRLLLSSLKNNIILFLKRLFCMDAPTQHLCVYKSFVFNLKAFGIKTALKFPVYVFSNTKVYSIGDIKFCCDIRPGLLSIGKADSKSQGSTKFLNVGHIEIYGPTVIGGCVSITNAGTIVFKGQNVISEGCTVVIKDKLYLGEYSRIGFHSFVMDSDEHFTIDVETKDVYPYTKPIEIGRFNWLGSYTFVKKGTKTPDYMIVASPNALLCKDYLEMPPYSVMGGSPVRLLKTGIRRIFDIEQQRKLNCFFRENENAKKYTFENGIDLEALCSY